jgi:hypothetical protein
LILASHPTFACQNQGSDKKYKKTKMMKKIKRIITVALALTASTAMHAQDIIVTTKAEKITAKVTEIDIEVVKYKQYDYQEGPTHTIKKSDIASIVYQNGKVEVFKSESAGGKTENVVKQEITKPTKEIKLEIIALYLPDFVVFKPADSTEFKEYSVSLVDGMKSYKALKTKALRINIHHDKNGKMQTSCNNNSEIRTMNFDIPSSDSLFETKKIKFVIDGKEIYYDVNRSQWE